MEHFTGLVPPTLWKYFSEILSIPRLSGHEDQVIGYLLEFARRNHLDARKDKTGNVVIRKPATPGFESLQTVILQSHLDMVGEKEPQSSHDFLRDPIKPVRKGGWITATSTTLGADDGIGIAAQMMILTEDSLEHGRIECLFTVDEESGMTGAKNLEPDFLKGSILLNLDSEDWGELFIGCAGGIDTLGTFRFELSQPDPNAGAFRLSVYGLRGGHSGDEIHKSPGNAIKIVNTILLKAGMECGLELAVFEGGNLRNAIPREAHAVFTIPFKKIQEFTKAYAVQEASILNDLKEFESGITLKLEETSLPELVLQSGAQSRFLQALDDCPHGVVKWSATLDNLVETSTNLASVKFTGANQALVTTSQRSSVESAKMDISKRVAACLEQGGARTEHSDGYPGWAPNTDSRILRIVSETYRELFGDEPLARAIHAGLECGLILQKYPGLDMISFGPTIKGAHTPRERLHIESTERFWKLLVKVLKKIPQES
jgi:dipeptidase D